MLLQLLCRFFQVLWVWLLHSAFPIVPSIAASSGLSEALLFSCIVVGAQASAISPFSSGGSLILGSCPDKYKEKLFKDLLIKAVPIGFIAAILATIIMSFIL